MRQKFHLFRFAIPAIIICLSSCLLGPNQYALESTSTERYQAGRLDMVDRVQERYNLQNETLLEAMREVPRHLFVPEGLRHLAYSDHALPISENHAVPAPHMAAWMIETLGLLPGERVLVASTGCGYITALLAQLEYLEIYSLEVNPEIAQQAFGTLHYLGYNQIHLAQRDGYLGWEENAPYDAIIVPAAVDHLPEPLIDQLADGGRLLIPIGSSGTYQTMWKFENHRQRFKAFNHGSVKFFPLKTDAHPQPLTFHALVQE